jgi:hypothetical protein
MDGTGWLSARWVQQKIRDGAQSGQPLEHHHFFWASGRFGSAGDCEEGRACVRSRGEAAATVDAGEQLAEIQLTP